MGRMTWDLTTCSTTAGLAEPAGRQTRTALSTVADSVYTVDRRGRLGIRAYMPWRTSWTYRMARKVLPCFQGHPSQPARQ
jgi:hypothetical protein